MREPHCIICEGCKGVPCECDSYPLGYLVVCRNCFRAGEKAMLQAARRRADSKGVLKK